MTKALKLAASALALAVAASFNSCGPKGTVIRADDYDAETIVDLMNEEEPVVHPHHSQKPGTPAKRPVVTTPLDGEWIIIKAKGKAISDDIEPPYIIFSDAEGRFYAYNGCNYINGDFEYKTNNLLSFSSVITTIRECPDVSYQGAISSVLKDKVTVKAKIENKDRESYLTLYSTSNNDALLVLRRHNLEVLNGKWEVEYIGDEEVDGSEINLFLDIPERAIHGNTGCNYFNGSIVIDSDKASSISFAQMGVTMRYCDNADIERMLLVALEEADTYTLKDANTLYLNDSSGKRLITLVRSK